MLPGIPQFYAYFTVGLHPPAQCGPGEIVRDLRRHRNILNKRFWCGVEHDATVDTGVIKEIMEV
ncbi:hypothetical protein NGUA18_04222 [Salmonella enterica]|nr:hypothetical protein NGUA18_04222 [Salmonella enterica]